ncbi:MAG TPA: DnaB-like helicase C-terminal domain-containing protein, partial [Ureibacillus sp.]|nr:DnaB-like helicase C-terminal domain-containing protein [Ureibacillus sp.]
MICSQNHGNRTNIIDEISWAIKQMAKEFNCPVVCLSQLNRSVEGRQNKRPMISDLRDSGNIEQDADVVILLYRDQYYGLTNNQHHAPKSTPFERLELIVAKNRNGSTGVAYAAYNKATGEIVGL